MIRAARNREPGVHLKTIDADFEISQWCLANWLTAGDAEDRAKPGVTAAENDDLRAAKKRIRLLDQDVEAGRLTPTHLSQGNLPGA